MTTFYRRLQLRHGLRWHTGAFRMDWKLAREGALAILYAALFFVTLDSMIDMAAAADELRIVRSKLQIREQQIVDCLNGRPSGMSSCAIKPFGRSAVLPRKSRFHYDQKNKP